VPGIVEGSYRPAEDEYPETVRVLSKPTVSMA